MGDRDDLNDRGDMDETDSGQINSGKRKIMRHELPESLPDGITFLSDEEMEEIQSFIAEHFGETENVLHEILSEIVHLDLLPVAATDDFPFVTICTMGMSALPMHCPEDSDDSQVPRHIELIIHLPADYPVQDLGSDDFDNENWWPIEGLKFIARIPFMYETFIAVGHTIPNGDPPSPFSPRTNFVCWLVLPEMLNSDAQRMEGTKRNVTFLQIVPIYLEEMNFIMENGADAFFQLIDEKDIEPDMFSDLERPNICAE
jgi:hypothetical protein